MNILFISRSTIYSGAGGDTVQIQNTARYLEDLGVRVTIALSNERIDYATYDLIHFFNMIRPADILHHIRISGLPYVLSTIYLDYSEYDKKLRPGVIGMVNRTFGSNMAEYLKVIARRVKNGEKIVSPAYLVKGHKRSIQYILRHTACLLPNSHSEYRRIVRDYGVENRYTAIPNAIDKDIFQVDDLPGMNDRSGILCVARIDQYKNQLNLIRAVKDSPYQLKLAGKPAPNHLKYYARCVEEAASMDNVEFLGQCSPKELAQFYLKARVHVLPSWCETTGLSSLEAAAMGCSLVIVGKGDTREYFEDYVQYCEPDDIASIRLAIDKAYETPGSTKLREKILCKYTWENAATATFDVYKKVLNAN